MRRFLFSRWFSYFDALAILCGVAVMQNVNIPAGVAFIVVASFAGSMLEPTP